MTDRARDSHAVTRSFQNTVPIDSGLRRGFHRCSLAPHLERWPSMCAWDVPTPRAVAATVEPRSRLLSRITEPVLSQPTADALPGSAAAISRWRGRPLAPRDAAQWVPMRRGAVRSVTRLDQHTARDVARCAKLHDRGKDGAGDGARTHDIQLGKLER